MRHSDTNVWKACVYMDILKACNAHILLTKLILVILQIYWSFQTTKKALEKIFLSLCFFDSFFILSWFLFFFFFLLLVFLLFFSTLLYYLFCTTALHKIVREIFLVACTRLYKSLCRSVGRSVGLSVWPTLLFCVFQAIKGREAQI